MRVVAGIALGLATAACGGGGADAPPDADLGCEGTPPGIEECPRGFLFAECGGVGEPRLACEPEGECYWFTGGCVARGFEPSTCAAADVCCHEAYDDGSTWPYPDRGFRRSALHDLIYGFGTEPWDRTRAMTVDLAVDPALTATVAPAWTSCEGTNQTLEYGSSPCTSPGEASATLGATLSIVSQYANYTGWNVLVEVDRDLPRARVCAYLFTHLNSTTCDTSGAICAETGTVTLDRLPATDAELPGLAVSVDVTFPGPYHLAGSFALPP